MDFVQHNFPSVNMIRNPENEGFAGGYNRALAGVEADYFVLLNQDVEVSPGWIQPLVELMRQYPAAAACQPKIRSYHRRDAFEYAGAAGGWMDRWGYTFCRGRIFDTVEEDSGQYDSVSEIFWASGAALFIRASAFREAGGLDPYFFAHMEEIDLCWRLQLAGHSVLFCPGSVVYHVGGGSLPQGNPKKTYLNFRNNLVMMSKNLPAGEKRWKIPARLLLDGIAGIKSLLGGRPSDVPAILRAHYHFYRWLLNKPSARRTKERTGRPPRLDTLRGVYRGSILWQYFIRRNRYFSRLK